MKDDAGKPVRILNPNGFAEWPVRGDERVARVARRIGVGLGDLTWAQIATINVVQVVGGLAVAAAAIRISQRLVPGGPGWLPIVILGAVIVTMVYLRRRWLLGRNKKRSCNLLLEEGLCASCGYNLVGVQEQVDGVFVCPECGSAWRVGRIKRREAFASNATMGPGLSLIGTHVLGKRVRVRDDAGVVVRVPRGMLREAIRTSAQGSELHARLKQVRRTAIKLAVPYIIIGVAGIGIVTAVGLSAENRVAAMPIVILVDMAFLGMITSHVLGQDSPRYRKAMLQHQICSICAGNLASAAPGPDGLTACSCGAKWRMPVVAEPKRL